MGRLVISYKTLQYPSGPGAFWPFKLEIAVSNSSRVLEDPRVLLSLSGSEDLT